MTVPNGLNSSQSVSSSEIGPSYLKAKIRIGSCKGPISYGAGQQVFHHDDIPEARRARKEEVREWAKSKILSASRGEWDKSNQLNKNDGYGYPICERRQAENMIGDRSLPYNYNYRAETLDYAHITKNVDQPGKFHISRTATADISGIETARLADRVQRGYFKRTQEMPTHPNIVDKTAWNISTNLTVKEKKIGLDNMTNTARVSTARVNKHFDNSMNYQKPSTQQKYISKTVRDQKQNGIFVGGPNGTFNGHHVLQPDEGSMPSVSRTTTSAPGSPNSISSSSRKGTNKDVNSKSRPTTRMSSAPQEAYTTKNRYSVEPSRKFATTKHSGVWEYSKADGCMMWSDTGSFTYDSRGDVIKMHNPDSLNLEGPTLSKPSRKHLLKPKDHVDHR
jgi:hypothetical protein